MLDDIVTDPGYFASLRGGTQLAAARWLGLGFAVIPLVVLLIVLSVRPTDARPWLWLVPALYGALAVVIGPRLGLRIRALPEGLGKQEAMDRSLLEFRASFLRRMAYVEGTVLLGLVAALGGGGLLAYLVGFVIGWPLMLLALPTYRVIERIRVRLEASGVQSYLWEGLTQPARQS